MAWIERRETRIPHQLSSLYIRISQACPPRKLVIMVNIFFNIFMWRSVCTSQNIYLEKWKKKQGIQIPCFQFIDVYFCAPLLSHFEENVGSNIHLVTLVNYNMNWWVNIFRRPECHIGFYFANEGDEADYFLMAIKECLRMKLEKRGVSIPILSTNM